MKARETRSSSVDGVGEANRPRPVGLGHVGIHCHDLARMKDFYTRVLGLTVTDESDEIGMVFLSSQPEREHHELALVRGRTTPVGSVMLNQISFHVAGIETLKTYLEVFRQENVKIQQIVTHGIAIGVYAFDPEGNRFELYWDTGVRCPQPYSKAINLDQAAHEVLAEAERLLADTPLPAYRQAAPTSSAG